GPMLDDARHVITEHYRHWNIAQAEIGGFLARGTRAADRIGRTHVADDAHAVAHARRQHHAQTRMQRWRIALIGIFTAGKILTRDRALGKTFENEIVD